jgi:hypothetical protein
MNTIYCLITKKQTPMTIRLLLRLLFFILLALIKAEFGMDWALIFAATIIAADIDEIARLIENRGKGCK